MSKISKKYIQPIEVKEDLTHYVISDGDIILKNDVVEVGFDNAVEEAKIIMDDMDDKELFIYKLVKVATVTRGIEVTLED
jgi:hypothetical protein